MSVLDLSNWDYSTFDPECLRRQGVERIIVGNWDRAITADITARSRAAGILVEDYYAFVYYRLPWERREVENALANAATYGGIQRIWIDCESTFTDHTGDLDTEAAGTTPAQRIMITANVERGIALRGIEPGIYTGESWWRSNMGNTSIFSDLKLWLANYGTNNPSNPRPPITLVNFGGWTRTSAHQYSSTIRVCNRERDHNYWFIPAGGEDAPMTPAERAEFDALKQTVSDLANIVVRNGIDTDGDGKVDMNGDAALAHAVVKGWSAFLSASDANRKIAAHSEHAGQVTDAWSGTGTFTGTFTPEEAN